MSAITDILKTVAPGIATALGGPLASIAMSFLASKLGVDPAVVEQTIAGMKPEDLVRMKELDQQFQVDMAKIGISLDMAQIGVNTEEAKSASLFIAGGRPAVIWIGAVSLAYASIIEPLLRFVAQVGFHYTGAFPVIDTGLTMQVLFGVLGLSGLRSFEKFKGIDTQSIGGKNNK